MILFDGYNSTNGHKYVFKSELLAETGNYEFESEDLPAYIVVEAPGYTSNYKRTLSDKVRIGMVPTLEYGQLVITLEGDGDLMMLTN